LRIISNAFSQPLNSVIDEFHVLNMAMESQDKAPTTCVNFSAQASSARERLSPLRTAEGRGGSVGKLTIFAELELAEQESGLEAMLSR